MKANLMLGVVSKKISRKIFLLLTAFFLIGGFFVVKMAFADPIFSVTAAVEAVDVGQTKDLTFNVIKATGETALKTIAISEVGTGFSSPTSIVCPTGWSVIPAMPPIVNGYVCNDPTGVGLDSTSITLKGMIAPASAGVKDFSVSAINTGAEPKTENVKTQITVKDLKATATISPITTNIKQERTYTLNLTNNSATPGDDITQVSGTLAGFNITSCSTTSWTTCTPSGDSFILSDGSLAPTNSVDISVIATAPANSGAQTVSAQITGALGGTANATISQNVIQVQTPADLAIGDITSDKVYISKNSGAINSSTVSADITNNGKATANTLVKTLVIKDALGVDISNQFVITEATTTAELLGNETKTLSWIVTANASTSIEALVKAEVSVGYNDINTGVIAITGPATKVNDQIFTVDNTAPVIVSHSDEVVEATGHSGAIVKYTAPSATDNMDTSATISSCTPVSGTTFSIGSTTITCVSSDKAGNVATPAVFVINVVDTTAPVITMKDVSPITLEYGKSYTDAGATALDIVDLSVSVIASGTVNTLILGTYEISYNAVDAHNNHAIQVVRTVNVVKKAITVAANAQTKTYGEVDPELTYTFTPALISGDSFTGTLSRAAGKNVGTYAIAQNTLTLTAGDNYNLTYVGANLTISKRAITITATTDTKPYDSTITSTATSTMTSGTLANSETATWTQTFDNKNVGTKTLTPTGSVADGNNGKNYNVTFVNNTGGITAISATGSVVVDSKVYDDTTTATIKNRSLSGVISNDTVSYVGGSANFDTKNVGIGKIVSISGLTISGADAGNYTVNNTATTTANITTLPITITADTQTKTYGEDDPTLLTYTFTPALISGDSFTGVLIRAVGENVGIYAITQNGLTAGTNYVITFVGANLTINPGLATQANIVADYVTAEVSSTTVKLTITVKDVGGNLVADGTTVALTTSLGEVIGLDTTKNGVVSRALTSNTVGNAILTISGLTVSGSTTINFKDTTKPVIVGLTPSKGSSTSNAKPTISAQFTEIGSGINKNKVTLVVDLDDVTEFATITDSGISYVPPFEMSTGFHNVTVNVSDNTGNEASSTWKFAIIDPAVIVAPLSVSQWPVDGTTGVDLNAHPYIQFSKLMNENTLVAGNVEIRLHDAQTTAVSSAIVISTVNNATRVTFIPNSSLTPNVKYFFYIGSGVKDLADYSLNETWTTENKARHEFTTRALYTNWNISLNQGWNLISLPLIPTNSHISAVLAGISSKVDIAKYYDATTSSWLSYVPGVGGTLTTMEDGKGYWINMKSAGTLNITGVEMPIAEEFPPMYSFVENKWNLIGFKSVVNMTAGDYINGYTKASYNDEILWNYKSGQYSSTNAMESGYGYWLFVK
ncbi:MAG: MBG domain-containing protein [Patescibacteria group bacterium]